MKDRENHDFEERLRTISLTPAPADLRERILDAARRHKASKSWTSPRQRLWLTVCAAVLLLVFVGEGFVSNVQRTRLVALSGAARPEARPANDQNGLRAEVLGDAAVPRPEAAALGGPDPRGAAGKKRAEAPQIRLSPSLSEDPEIEVLTEDSHDGPKSLH